MPTPDADAHTLIHASHTHTPQNSYLPGLSGDYLAKNPGEYKIKLYNEVDSPAYVSLQMHTPLGSVRLIPEEVEVINDLRLRCCPPGSTSQMCSSILPTVTSPTRTANQDLCRLAPNHCGPTGRLRQLILAGAGLNCGNMGLPASFSRLTELRTLDLARNAIGGGTAALAGVIASVRARVFFGLGLGVLLYIF
jgi:hypothetical protein